jgi:ribosome-associated toxin RatA of RatAB toxin-antitoxin module
MNGMQDISKAFKWQFRLAENSQTRMRFVLPRVSLFVVASISSLIGLVFLLFPHWFAKQSQFLVPVVGWICVFLSLCLYYFVMTRSGEVVVDSFGRYVAVKFKSPKEQFALHIPFSDFVAIETRQVKDMHGLHNHWSIDLVGRDDVRIKLGAGFNGTFRKKVRDKLVNQMSEMTGIPVVTQD